MHHRRLLYFNILSMILSSLNWYDAMEELLCDILSPVFVKQPPPLALELMNQWGKEWWAPEKEMGSLQMSGGGDSAVCVRFYSHT